MTAPMLSECAGLWRRTLLIHADGSCDAATGVVWLQGVTAYVDSRGFAGRLHQHGNVFQWHRSVELEPSGPLPDAGAMHWVGDTLVETGVHEDYVEHWVRDGSEPVPCWAQFLSADGGVGQLLRVGDVFAFAGGGTVVIGPVGGAKWTALAVETSGGHLRADGVRWTIEQTEGNVNQ